MFVKECCIYWYTLQIFEFLFIWIYKHVFYFQDFCGPSCMEKYEYMSNKSSVKSIPNECALCAVCNQEKLINVLFDEFESKHKFCSEPCFIAFKYVNNVDPRK